MKPILQTINRGSSGTGLSHYLQWLGCPRYAALKSKQREVETPEYYEVYSSALVGIITHSFLELFFTKELKPDVDEVAVKYEYQLNQDARLEAERCFKAFRDKFGAEHFGNIVAVEYQIDSEQAVCDVIGINPFTARLDLVVELTEKDIKRLFKERTPDGIVQNFKPGIWIVDHKVFPQQNKNLIDKALNSFQFTAYQLAWNALNPDWLCKGVLQNTIFNKKEVDYRLTVVPSPSEQRIKALRKTLEYVKEVQKNNYALPIPSDHNCFPYGGLCPFLQNMTCARS